ncbi:MAG: FecR domain-containing protein [Pseudomonadota bacterium]
MKPADEDDQTLSRIAHEWRERINGGDATEADRQALDAWLAEDIRHEEAFDRAETYWAAFDHLRRDDIDADLMPQAKAGLLAQFLQQTKALFTPTPMKFAMAAATIAVIAVPVALNTPQTEPTPQVPPAPTLASFETGTAETKVVTLDDGTVATLGARTRIETVVSDRARTVTLRGGAAFFDVEPDASRPFSVQAGELTATALGTEFDVRSNGGVFRVAVAEGRVEVAYPYMVDNRPTWLMTRRTLDHGQEVAATKDEGLRAIRTVAAQDVGAWREQKLIYDGGTLGELVADANRYSDREIVLTESARGLADRTITASFDANNIDRMLSMLALSYPIEIDDSDGGTLRLRAKDDPTD